MKRLLNQHRIITLPIPIVDGWTMPERQVVSSYRYGYNGQETDKEWRGGQAISFRFRVSDPRLGRFLSVDPLAPEYPWYTPYQFAGNMVIQANELEGLEPDGTASEIIDRSEDLNKNLGIVGRRVISVGGYYASYLMTTSGSTDWIYTPYKSSGKVREEDWLPFTPEPEPVSIRERSKTLSWNGYKDGLGIQTQGSVDYLEVSGDKLGGIAAKMMGAPLLATVAPFLLEGLLETSVVNFIREPVKRMVWNVTGQGIIHSTILGFKGDFSWKNLGNRIDVADVIFASTGGGLFSQVILPTTVDYNGGKLSHAFGGGKGGTPVIIDGIVNFLFFGAGKYIDYNINFNKKEFARISKNEKAYRTAYNSNPSLRYRKPDYGLENLMNRMGGEATLIQVRLEHYRILAPVKNLGFDWRPDFMANPLKE